MLEALGPSPRNPHPWAKPPASPALVRLLDFLLVLLIVALQPFALLPELFAPSGRAEGAELIWLFLLPVLGMLWLIVIVWSRFRRVPALDLWLVTIALAALGSMFLPIVARLAPAAIVLLCLCAIAALVAIFVDFGRFERPAPTHAQSPASAVSFPGPPEPGGGAPAAQPRPRPAPSIGRRMGLKILGIAVAVTAVQILFAASPLSLMVDRLAENLGLAEPLHAVRQDWFGVVMLVLVLAVLEGRGFREGIGLLELGDPRRAFLPAALLIVPALPLIYFGADVASRPPHLAWPPGPPALLFLVLQALFLEGFYRGYLLGGLTRRGGWHWLPALVLSTVLASALGLDYALSVDPYWPFVWIALIGEAEFSLFSGVLFLANRGNLYPSLLLRLVSPFILIAAYQGTTTARIILGGWGALVLAASALVTRRAAQRAPLRPAVTPVGGR
jgi:hypothetical protein